MLNFFVFQIFSLEEQKKLLMTLEINCEANNKETKRKYMKFLAFT